MSMNTTPTLPKTLPQTFLGALAPSSTGAATATVPRIESQQLFGASSHLFIGHNGEQYRLQRTRANKLILTK